MTTTSGDAFRSALQEMLQAADNLGLVAVEVNSGKLHRKVGGYPGSSHRMPVCCDVMRQEMSGADSVVSEPESGQGASLVIRYVIPRA